MAKEQEAAQQVPHRRDRGWHSEVKPAEHATVVVSLVDLVDSFHLLVHAPLELLVFLQQLHRHDKLAKWILFASQVPEVKAGRFNDHGEWVDNLLDLDLMFDFGALIFAVVPVLVSFEIQNDRLVLTFILRAVIHRQDIGVRQSLALSEELLSSVLSV